MKFRIFINKLTQGIIIALIILFFLNLSTRLPFAPEQFNFIRSFAELHFLKQFSVIVLISALITFLSDRVFKKRRSPRLIFPFEKRNEKRLLVIVFILALLLNCLGSFIIYDNMPHITSEVSFLLQAKIFTMGRLYAPAPVSPQHFCTYLEIADEGKWYTKSFPGVPLILTIGILTKMPWLINPILGALSLLIIYLIGKELYDRKIAIYAVILGFFSPLFLLCNSTFCMDETTTMFFILLFILCFSRMVKRDSNRYPLLAGLCLGMAFITRPYTALFASLPFFGYLFYLFLKKRGGNVFKKACLLGAGAMIFILLLLWYNWKLTGNLFNVPYLQKDTLAWMQDYNKNDYPGFHRSPLNTWDAGGLDGRMHTPIKALLNTDRSFILLNRELFGWPVSLIFIFIPFLFLRKNKWDILLLFVFLSVVLGYSFYWLGWLRYWFPAMPALLFLTARGIDKMPLLLRRISIPRKTGRKLTAIFVTICFLYSFMFWFPYMIKYGNNLHFISNKIFKKVKTSDIHNAIIFMGCRPPLTDSPFNYLKYFAKELRPTAFFGLWIDGLWRNSPLLDGDILYARDLGKRNNTVMKHYPGRKFFIYSYDFNNQTDELREIHAD